MSLAVMMVFEILPALALGFVVGRFWQVRRDELDRRIFKGVARIRRLQSPTQWEVGVRSTLLRAEHASMWEEYRISDRAGRPSRPDHWAASFRVAARQAVAAVCG